VEEEKKKEREPVSNLRVEGAFAMDPVENPVPATLIGNVQVAHIIN
jgi:hypothetical protein